jgi:amino acid adenylation domain-containing protein
MTEGLLEPDSPAHVENSHQKHDAGDRLTEDRLAGQRDYWLEQLADLPMLRLPTDRPQPAVPGAVAATHVFRVPVEVVRGMVDLAHRSDASPFTVLLTACQVLFSRYGRQHDIPVATTATGRTQEHPTGHFTNVVVLRSTIDPDASFALLLERNTGTLADALANADLPFPTLVDALALRRDEATPPAQVLVTLADAAAAREQAPWPPQRFEMTVEVQPTDAGDLAGTLTYDPDQFDAATIRRLVRHLLVLLTAAVRDATRPVGNLPLLDDLERRSLLTEWGVNRVELPTWLCVHELVGEQARLRPDAVAVATSTATMTYGDLDTRANQLANLLVSGGVRRGGIVAVCLPRGPRLVTALLAVLRAGCAYLPLDPAYPVERLDFMLADADVSACLTESGLTGKLRDATDVEFTLVDQLEHDLAAQPVEPPRVPVTGRDAAYVIYTSGSTGRPKGTVVEHRSITRLLCAPDYIALRADDVVAQGADATFDAATFEIWAPLVAGARMVVVDKNTMLDPTALVEALHRHRITTLVLTTALFNQVVAARPDAFRTLRHLLFGGEAVNPDRVAQVLAAGPPQRLLHSYGPTETTTFATWHLVDRVDEHRTVPIGRPVVNTSVHVLDERLNPVPVGVVGELFIGGPGVARGYLARPRTTAARFLPNPFDTTPGGRLYRTGDLVRWAADGVLEYVGRVDRQVKVRGYRIEPNEIELVLQQHQDVDAAVAVVRDDGEHKRLVGYVRPVPGRRPAPAALRDLVAGRLPEFMVPAVVVLLDEFPLTPSGKVDRAALPAPEHTADTGNYVAPRTDDERVLAAIWADVLDLDVVGITDNYYELGGDSILGIKIVAKARAAGVEISAKNLFRRQTIAALVAEPS